MKLLFHSIDIVKKIPEKPDSKIAALTTQVNELKHALDLVQSGTHSNGRSKKLTTTSDRRNNIAERCKKKSHGKSVQKDDKTWYWCPHHKGQDYDGLYVMHKPENHDKHQHRFKKDKSENTLTMTTSNASTNKLAMKDSLKTAMVAKFRCTSGVANKLWADVVKDKES